MNSVSVAVLKEKLSSYLHRVEAGEELVVTSHRRPVARLTPTRQSGVQVRTPLRPISALARVKGVRLSPGRTSLAVLLEDRSRR